MAIINFQFDTQYGQYCDALILTDEEQAALSDADIEAMKQERLKNWLSIFETPQE
jgi:hypothetical protein